MQLLLSTAWLAAASALSATTQPPSTRVKLPHLKAEAFRHPLDKDVTAAVPAKPAAVSRDCRADGSGAAPGTDDTPG